MFNVARLPVTAAVAIVAVVGIALLSPFVALSDRAAIGFKADGARDRERHSVLVQGADERLGRHRSHRGQEVLWRGDLLNKSIVGPQGAEAIIYWTSFPDGDYADPCARVLAPSIGRSAADLAAAVAAAPGTKLVKGARNLTLGGHPAKHVVLTVRESVGCDPGFFYSWRTTAAVRFGGRRMWATRSGYGSSPWTAHASSSQPRAAYILGRSTRKSSRLSGRSGSSRSFRVRAAIRLDPRTSTGTWRIKGFWDWINSFGGGRGLAPQRPRTECRHQLRRRTRLRA